MPKMTIQPTRPACLTLTPGHIERVHRPVPEQDPMPGRTPMTDELRAEMADKLLAANPGGPFWIFAYGSLIWKPAFEFTETCTCTAHGWHRSFCIDMESWRATPEQRGLMLALDRGGSCTGVAYRMPDDDPHGRMVRLLEREMGHAEAFPWLRWLTVRAGSRSFRALTFYCAPPDGDRLIRLPVCDQVHRLARAVGPVGSCADYLLNTVTHLEALGIRDSYLWKMQALVAAEIDAITEANGWSAPPDR